MKKNSITLMFTLFSVWLFAQSPSVLVETESFENKGGWVVDQQFIPSMGSPYLLAHGMGEPVENASTTVTFPENGRYWFWVRTKDWVPDHPDTPGTFKIIFDGDEYPETFGVNEGWQWVQS
jgi:hypothetical protein